jgi:hypothetical protein
MGHKTMIHSRILATAACIAGLFATPAVHAVPPPDPTVDIPPISDPLSPPPRQAPSKKARRELIAGGVLLGLGFATELAGAVISVRCEPGDWCSGAIAGSVGGPDGPNRYTFVSTGPSNTYVMGRMLAAPFLLSGFTLTMVGLASTGTPLTHTKERRIAWSLFGTGIGILVASRLLRIVFLATGTCQTAMCVHGFDQSTLWAGRGLTFAGTGLLVRGAARRHELGFGPGPFNSYGLSLSGRF